MIAKCDLEWSLIYDTALSIYEEDCYQKKIDLLTCQSLRTHFFFQFQLLLHNSEDKDYFKDRYDQS